VADRVPVLWITGPAGVGKTTAAWQVFSDLARAGVRVAFADADQLCMCFPAPPGDPARERLKARNAGLLIPGYRAAGAQCVIMSGCLEPGRGLDAGLMPQAEVTLCRLRADPEEIAGRLTERNGPGQDPGELLEEVRAGAAAFDASTFAGVCVETTGVAAAGVAGLVRDSCGDWPGFSGRLPGAEAQAEAEAQPQAAGGAGAGGQIVLICGPTGVGKSTIGFQLLVRYVNDGLTAAYVDLDQISFARPGPDGDPGGHRLKAAGLAAMWRTYRAAGATHLIATGPIDSEEALQAYARALPAARVTAFRLHAGPAELRSRILSRGEGGSWPQPGDPLRGQPAACLNQVATQAIATAKALEQAGTGTLRIDTNGHTAAESADLIAETIS
jgi:hypothetical protein